MSVPVRQCRNASRMGCTGIVMQETANTFKVVTKANTLKGLMLPSTVQEVFSYQSCSPPKARNRFCNIVAIFRTISGFY
jgi:hypothetical protein